MRRELKQYTRKYLFNTKKGSNGGIEEQKKHKIQETNIKIVDVNATLRAITLNIDGLSMPIKRHIGRWNKKKIQLSALYNRHILGSKTQTD